VTELQQNRYDQLLRRVGDLKGPGSKVNDVLQELFPTLDVENVPGELLLLMGTRIGWASTTKSPTAGKRAGIQLFNPAASGQLITVSSFVIAPNSSTTFSWGLTESTLATNTGIPRLRDGRIGDGAEGVAELRTSPDEVALSSGAAKVSGSQSFTITDGNSVCVLSPGTGIKIIGAIDIGFSASFFYRERIAEPSELTF